MSPRDMSDYVDVAERIRQFKAQYPDGSLQSIVEPRMVSAGDKAFVIYGAAAYRTPDDPRPGLGWAWEPVPGPTPFTRDSELMNAETSAWGRAIVALGFETKKIASRQEVRNRQEFVPPEASGAEVARKASAAPEEHLSAAERPVSPATLGILKQTVEALQKGFKSPDPNHSYWNDVQVFMHERFDKTETAKLTEAEGVQLVMEFEHRLAQASVAESQPYA